MAGVKISDFPVASTLTDAYIPIIQDGSNKKASTTLASVHVHSNITALNAVSGTNTGDQDLSGYSLTSHDHDSDYEPANSNIQGHISSTSNPHSVTKTQLGIENVTNDSQVKRSEMGAAGGVATLNAVTGFVESAQLPSYVDDVIEVATLLSFPATGESGKIYVAIDTNLTYRWSGTVYVEISSSLALGTTSSTAFRGDYGQTAYSHSQVTHAPSDAEKNVQSDWTQATDTSDDYIKNKPILGTAASAATTDFATATQGSNADTHAGLTTTAHGGLLQLGLTETTAAAGNHHHDGSYEAANANIQAHIISSHAPSGAEQNVQSDWTQSDTGADDYIKNKPTVTAIKRGSSVLDFGAAPGTNVIVNTISGQTDIISDSRVEAFIMGIATAEHNAYEHMIAPIRLVCGNIVEGTSFDIMASTDLRLTGTFNIKWTWV